jgi:D-lactate dehydrogenase
MECGFCEPVCPSRKLSLTPRQRNTVARHIATLSGKEKTLWLEKYQYYGIDTCAATGMCKTACPVGINTGKFILEQKPESTAINDHAKLIKAAKTKVQLANVAASLVGRKNLQSITSYAHAKIKSIPIFLESMPKAQRIEFSQQANPATDILLVPACPNRIFAGATEFSDYPSKLVLEKMGYTVKYIDEPANTCCGQMYHSQAKLAQQQQMTSAMKASLQNASIAIIDNSSCSGFLANAGINLIDINEFIVAKIDRNKLTKKYKKIALHIDCSTAKHSFNPGYLEVLKLCSDEVLIPEGIKCCGFAGDKGFFTPELNASSLSDLAPQVTGCEIGVTFNRSCQIGLTHHGKVQYISFVEMILNCLPG